MRGEYPAGTEKTLNVWELPPHARRILLEAVNMLFHVGTTSACAENTLWRRLRLTNFRNYLRMRGEYISRRG